MSDMTKKWETTGLLDNLPDTQKDECALILNQVALILVENAPDVRNIVEYNKYDEFCGIIMPVVRKIFERIYPKKFPRINFLIQDLQQFLNENSALYNGLKKSSDIALDTETEIGNLYIENIIERIK